MARMKWFFLGLLIALAVLGNGLWLKRTARPPDPTPLRTLIVEGQNGPEPLRVEIAADPAAWQRGLMFRRDLPEDRGMLFVFPAATGEPFWMKNTLIPLSVAFADKNGLILRILDMAPCKKDPCPTYYPGVAYRQALEVNQGWFERHGVREGDRWRLK
jgi:uncharacterized membrane protein (UPF0127 family)